MGIIIWLSFLIVMFIVLYCLGKEREAEEFNNRFNCDDDYDNCYNCDHEYMSYEDLVEEFHEKFNMPIESTPRLPERAELKARLIEEEAKETADAFRRGDLVEAVDGMCDILYVTFGAALEAGVDLWPYFEEVHRTNMAKIGGGIREDGKVLKPEGWQPPRIKEMLIEDGAKL